MPTRTALPPEPGGLTYTHMVVDELGDGTVDRLFHALADTTRRDILRRCVRGELSVSRPAEAHPMSFAARSTPC